MHSKKVTKKLGTAALTGALSLGLLTGETLPFFAATVYAAEEKTQSEDGTASSDDKKDDSKKDDTSKDDSKKDDSKKDDSSDSKKDDSDSKKEDASKDDSDKKDDTSGDKKDDTNGSSSKVDETGGDKKDDNGNSGSSTDETKPSDASKLPETDGKTDNTGSTTPEVTPSADPSKTPETEDKKDTTKDDDHLSDEDELKREEEIANDDDDDDGEGNEELISHQTIIHLPALEEDFRFWTVSRVYGFAKEKLTIYEETDKKAKKVGELQKSGLLYILKTEKDGWYYVESGDVRGFVKKDKVYTGDKAQEMLKNFQTQAKALADRRGKEYTGISSLSGVAKALVDPSENEAYTYYRATVQQTVVDKVYALSNDKVNVRDSQSEKGKIVGRMKKGALCYVIADQDQDWVYIESGKVRGFVQKKYLQIADAKNQLEKEITDKGEKEYKTATTSVDPEKNKALYYTLTSIKSGTQANSIRKELLEYAAQFAGNPYKWGGSSLTHGTDCSGFAMRIYQKFGYKLPRTSRAQSHCGTKIAVEDARPGDLIFYAKKGHVYHVTIYAGDGKTIEAANEKLGICSLRANRKNAVWAVHLIDDENENVTESEITEKNASKKQQGKLLGDYKISYYSNEENDSEKAGKITDEASMLVEGNTVAVSEAVAKEGEELIINGHLYTATNSKTDLEANEVAIYVNSTEKEQTMIETTSKVYKAKS